MNLNWKDSKFQIIVVALVSLILCGSNFWGYPIYILDEAKNAEAAREMFENQNWITPTFNNELRTDKPPLHYFFMMLAYSIFGVSTFAARFFSVIFGMLTLTSTYYFSRKFAGQKVANYTILVLWSSIFFLLEFHLAVPDPYLIFFTSFALFNFYDFHKNHKWLNWFLFYISIGLAVLAKGPIAIAVPGFIILVFFITRKVPLKEWFTKYKPILGGILCLTICVPWFVLVHLKTDGAFTKGFFIDHNLNRFGSEMEGHGGVFLITWVFVLLGLLPTSFFIVQSFVKGFQQKKQNEFLWFSFLVGFIWILFFSISSTKLPNYPMPCYPFLAILIGTYFSQIFHNQNYNKWFKVSFWVVSVISILIPIASYVAITYAEPQLKIVNHAAFAIIPTAIGGILGIYYLLKMQSKKGFLALIISYILLNFGLFFYAFPKLTSQSPVELAKSKIKPKITAILYKGYDPAFLFNFQTTFPFTESAKEVEIFLQNLPNGVVITKKKKIDESLKKLNLEPILEQKSLFENHSTVILKSK